MKKKKNILRRFSRIHMFCLHGKFQVSYSTPSRFVKKMTYFCIIFAEKYFPAKYLRFYTSTKNFIKIRPKMSKRQPIKKKTFFYLFPLLTYSAMDEVKGILHEFTNFCLRAPLWILQSVRGLQEKSLSTFIIYHRTTANRHSDHLVPLDRWLPDDHLVTWKDPSPSCGPF